jgi:NAD kinase/nicotinic acid mononucleotide adenylyltransferase
MIFDYDNVVSMHLSSNFEALRRFIPFIVVPFDDAPPKEDAWYRQKPHCLLDQDPIDADASSTDIRRMIAAGDSQVRNLVPECVLEYISTNELYSDDRHGSRTRNVKRVAVMIGSFDPPTVAQVRLVELLLTRGFEKVRILPAARIRDGVVVEHAEPVHRAALVDLAFGGRPRVEISFNGLEDERAVSPAVLFRNHDSDHEELYFVVTEEAVAGRDSQSDLRNSWQDGADLWAKARFLLVTHSPLAETRDLPPNCEFAAIADLESAELQHPADLRRQISAGADISSHVPPSVYEYIERHRLFQPIRLRQAWPTQWNSPRIRMVFDERNEKATQLAQRYAKWEDSDPQLILVLGGDGTMLHAIRRYWPLRLPFVGINTGHLGFLLNQDPFDSLETLDVTTYRMPMLQVTIENPAREVRTELAFSDAWIERQSGQAAWLRLDVNGETRVPKLVGDGLLVATPSGSSSYARAMGASPVPLDSQSLTIAGSNVFRPRFWNTLIMPADASIRIATLDDTGKRPVQAFIDGVPMGQATSMSICRSNTVAVELGFARDSDLSSKLLTSLLPYAEDE